MKPYYQDEFITLYNTSVMRLRELNTTFDFIFADPPFNVGVSYDGDSDNRPNYYEWQRTWVKMGFSSLSNRGSFYLMTITRHLPEVYSIMSENGTFISQIVWKNVSAVGDKRRYWRQYQPIVAYGKTDEYYFSPYAITRDGTRRWGGYSTEFKGQMGDIWDDIPFVYSGSIHHREALLEDGTNKKRHPAQMPEGLAYRMLAFSCPPDGVVLDMFSGSGTLLRVAKDAGIKAVGFEQSERYCELIAERVAQQKIPILLPIVDKYEQAQFKFGVNYGV